MGDRVQSVDRAIDILMSLAAGPKTLTEVCRATGLTKPTAFRLLKGLGYRGIVLKDPAQDNIYMLGPSLLPLLHGVSLGLGSLGTVARPVLMEVWRETEETVTLHVEAGVERVCIEEIASPHALKYTASVASRAPLHIGAAGKCLLAFLDDERRERTLAALPVPLESWTGDTITDLATLRRELDVTRRKGWAMSSGERVTGASAISVPVMTRGELVAALSVLGPVTRLPEARLRELGTMLKAAAIKVGERLAGNDNGQGP